MSNQNDAPAVQHTPRLLRMPLVLVCGTTFAAALALLFYPPTFEAVRGLLAKPISSAIAADDTSLAQRRKHRITDARTAVHGMFVKDPYGCVYMFEYVSAQLSLTPVRDEHGEPVCAR
jgi:hypothetical protein